MKFSTLLLLIVLMTTIACKTTKDANLTQEKQELSIEKAKTIFTNKVTVTVKEGAKPKSFEKRYKEYSLKYRGMSSKSQNIMAFTFSDSKITSPKLVELLKLDKDVINAVPLRKTETRATVTKSGDRRTGTLKK